MKELNRQNLSVNFNKICLNIYIKFLQLNNKNIHKTLIYLSRE